MYKVNIYLFIFIIFLISNSIYATKSKNKLILLNLSKNENSGSNVYLNDELLTYLPYNSFFSTQLDSNSYNLKINNSNETIRLDLMNGVSTFVTISILQNDVSETKFQSIIIDSITALKIINNNKMIDKSKKQLAFSSIVFYTEETSEDLYINSKKVSTIGLGNSYTFKCTPGTYEIGNLDNQKNLILDVLENIFYYVKVNNTDSLGFKKTTFKKITNLDEISKIQSQKSINFNNNKNKVKKNDDPSFLIGPSMGGVGIYIKEAKKNETFWHDYKNRFGLNLNIGHGLYKEDDVVLTSGDNSTFSFGGGIGYGLKYGREIKNLDLLGEYNYMESELNPVIQNGSESFKRYSISFTPSYVQHVGWKNRFIIRYGAGLDYYFGNKLEIHLKQLLDGYGGDLKYSNSVGYHLKLSIEGFISKRISFNLTGKLYGVRYQYESGYVRTNVWGEIGTPISDFLVKPNGAGIDMQAAINYYF